jgi:hypothetical protein
MMMLRDNEHKKEKNDMVHFMGFVQAAGRRDRDYKQLLYIEHQ